MFIVFRNNRSLKKNKKKIKPIDDFQYLILKEVINMFIVLRNNMPKELIVYLLFSY